MNDTLLRLRQKFLDRLINFYGPFVGAGVKMKNMTKDFRSCDVEMKLTFYNKNYMSTQFGGSLYSMTDPWYMLMLIKNLGPGYIVWDKSAAIRFKKPGRGKVKAHFEITSEVIEEIKAYVDGNLKMDKSFLVEIRDEDGVLIAEVDKVVYIRKKA
jgi:hypothetical protein